MANPSSQTAAQTGDDRPLPRLAVVLPCHNAEGWIARAIDSVLVQDHPDLAVIAVDDGSTDGTLAALRAYGAAVLVETGPNRGACHARNRGLEIAAAQGAGHVVFLDSDDFLEGPILRHAAALAVRTGADLVLSDTDIITAEGLRIVRRQHSGRVEPERMFASWLQGGFLMTGSMLWRLDFVRQIGWDESLSQFQDSDLVLRALLHRPLIVKNDTGVGVYMKENPAAISRRTSRRHLDSRLRVSLDLVPRIAGTSFAPAMPDLCWKLYKTARLAFLHGQADLGRRAMRGILRGSTQGAVWTWNWGLLARLIGLRARVRLRNL